MKSKDSVSIKLTVSDVLMLAELFSVDTRGDTSQHSLLLLPENITYLNQ